MIRAARLDTNVFEEVEHDRGATRQAAIVVAVMAILTGIGIGIGGGDGNLITIALGVAMALVGWAVYAWITYFIGTRILAGPETNADWGELARTLGFASTPQGLLIFCAIPSLITPLIVIVSIWLLTTTVVALRAALDFSTARAIGTALAGNIAYGLLRALVFGA